MGDFVTFWFQSPAVPIYILTQKIVPYVGALGYFSLKHMISRIDLKK